MRKNAILMSQKGFSLIEVLIAVLIFSIGLIGIAGLLVIATSADHGAYQRTQVAYLAQGMVNRMAANPVGVWDGGYNSDDYPVSTTQACSAGCTPTQIALHDQEKWSGQLKTFLPGPKASIQCTSASAGFAPSASNMGSRPPYGGSCTMTITWKDRGFGASSERKAQDETFAWEFQP